MSCHFLNGRIIVIYTYVYRPDNTDKIWFSACNRAIQILAVSMRTNTTTWDLDETYSNVCYSVTTACMRLVQCSHHHM